MHATLQERTEQERQAAREAARPRRRRILAAVAVPLLAVVAGASYVGTYDPLSNGGGVLAAGRDPGDFALRADLRQDSLFGGDFSAGAVDPPAGSRFGVAFGLANDGRFAVEVVDVRLSLGDPYFTEPIAFTSQARGGSGMPYAPLETFSLAPGRARDVGVSYRLPGCPDGPTVPSAGAVTFPSVMVTWRFLGVTRTTDVPLLDFNAGIQGLPQCDATG